MRKLGKYGIGLFLLRGHACWSNMISTMRSLQPDPNVDFDGGIKQ